MSTYNKDKEHHVWVFQALISKVVSFDLFIRACGVNCVRLQRVNCFCAINIFTQVHLRVINGKKK